MSEDRPISRQRKHVLARREKGLCAVEGCKEVSGLRYRCPVHAKRHTEIAKAYRDAVNV